MSTGATSQAQFGETSTKEEVFTHRRQNNLPEPLQIRLAGRTRRNPMSRDSLEVLEEIRSVCPDECEREHRRGERIAAAIMALVFVASLLVVGAATVGLSPAIGLVVLVTITTASAAIQDRRRESDERRPGVSGQSRRETRSLVEKEEP